MIRIFVVDDHEMVRAGVCLLIDRASDMVVVGESGSAGRTVALVAATRPDVIILDVNLPDGSGIELCRELLSLHPELRCLMLTGYGSRDAAAAATLAGASGYVLKTVHSGDLVEAIRHAASSPRRLRQNGSPLASGAAAAKPFAIATAPAGGSPEPELTHRQHQVLVLITDGMSNREIAAALGLKEKTVKNYVSGLLANLGMASRTQAAVYGARHRP
ncbi:response regulator transcription factor [Herbiconiux sp. CPCC 203407]|uniref:Response regulator transcription factor n=1 Tax=Herbiconiux oxytropis TaxID=2970915 RepID=A0AA41XEV9_9MICO|nr:response regulator transcription factor [Herbiconiux oxytropis]MCS5724149.1 response regulator transcription factor [Herbiconiux oxytropis]MCS5726916.1 response regulator transcription factor [Herbiconiux oxytropis]